MQKIRVVLSLGLSLCSLYTLKAEEVYIENNSGNEYMGAFVYVMGDKVSTPTEFFTIGAFGRTEKGIPSKNPLKGSRYLFVTSLYWMDSNTFNNSRLDSLKKIQQDDTANIIQIGRGGLTGSKKTFIIIDQYSDKKPNLSVDKNW